MIGFQNAGLRHSQARVKRAGGTRDLSFTSRWSLFGAIPHPPLFTVLLSARGLPQMDVPGSRGDDGCIQGACMKKVLIADDSHFQVQMLSHFLTEKGFSAIASFDALQAWMTALRETPDAIILDINMPGGSGLEVLRKLKFSAKTQQIPVIVISATSDSHSEQAAKDLGAAEFLQKPIDQEKLIGALTQLLG
jgi:two-component system, OmpR family, phosphate regulon response regulator PhoB